MIIVSTILLNQFFATHIHGFFLEALVIYTTLREDSTVQKSGVDISCIIMMGVFSEIRCSHSLFLTA